MAVREAAQFGNRATSLTHTHTHTHTHTQHTHTHTHTNAHTRLDTRTSLDIFILYFPLSSMVFVTLIIIFQQNKCRYNLGYHTILAILMVKCCFFFLCYVQLEVLVFNCAVNHQPHVLVELFLYGHMLVHVALTFQG